MNALIRFCSSVNPLLGYHYKMLCPGFRLRKPFPEKLGSLTMGNCFCKIRMGEDWRPVKSILQIN